MSYHVKVDGEDRATGGETDGLLTDAMELARRLCDGYGAETALITDNTTGYKWRYHAAKLEEI